MTQELHYTSVPRGLRPGSVGFCTVAQTANLPGTLAERLEGLSGYQQVFSPHDPSASLNPVAYSHLRISAGGRDYSVLSRVGFAGLDYTARSNKYAHHVVLDADERPAAGPARLLAHPGFLQSSWEGEPRVLPAGRVPHAGDRPPGIATAWGDLTGDPGWAGVLAESFLADPRRPIYLLFEPGMRVLPLFVEALALIPPGRRWDVELSTYFTQLPQGTSCPWRGVLADSPEARNAHRMPGALAIDLRRPPGEAHGGDLVHLARTGRLPDRPKGRAPAPAPRADAPGLPDSSPRLSSPGRSHSPGRAPDVGEFELSSHGPPRVPKPRTVRELEGFDDEPEGLPWGKIAGGIAASLLIALGAAYWGGMLDGLRGGNAAFDGIAKREEDTAKKKEKKQAEEKENAERETIAKQDPKKDKAPEAGKKDEDRPVTKEMAKDETPKPKEVAKQKPVDPQELARTKAAKEQAELEARIRADQPLVIFFGLPEIENQLNGRGNQPKELAIDFPDRILPPIEVRRIEVIQRDIAPLGDIQKDKVIHLKQQFDETKKELRIVTPAEGSLIADSSEKKTEAVSISIKDNLLSFRWGKLVKLADLIRDAVIKVDLKGEGTSHVLLRKLVPRTARIPLDIKSDNKSEQVVLIPVPWATNAENLKDCTWDLVITDWRIESTLAGEDQEPFTFASTNPNILINDHKDHLNKDIIEGELKFGVQIAKEILTIRLHRLVDIVERQKLEMTHQSELNTEKKILIDFIGKNKPIRDKEENPIMKTKLSTEIAIAESNLKNMEGKQNKNNALLYLYHHYLHHKQVYLDVGIGLRLSDGRVIEIARIGPRWAPKGENVTKGLGD